MPVRRNTRLEDAAAVRAAAALPARPQIAGIVNVTAESFSDGGRWLDPAAAAARAHELVQAGADLIDLGAASSRPGATPVPADEEMRRLGPVVERLLADGVVLSIDSFQPETQRWAIARGVAFLNDIQGFPHRDLHPELARADCRLVVMHSVQRLGPATRVATDTGEVVAGIDDFFATRIAELEAAGVARERIVLDPGMGFFLGRQPEVSIEVLRRLGHWRERFRLPVWVCVSRKSFVGQLTGKKVPERGAGTLASELFAANRGADYIRTHDVAALRDALVMWQALAGGAAG